jgi:hypothetical protein
MEKEIFVSHPSPFGDSLFKKGVLSLSSNSLPYDENYSSSQVGKIGLVFSPFILWKGE